MNPNKSLNITPSTSIKRKAKPNDFAEFDDISDAEIWNNFNLGNADILIYLYHRYVSQLLRFGLQFAPREAVKDSIQDLFLSLKERKNQTSKVNNIGAYLYKGLYRIIKKKMDFSKNLSSVDEIYQSNDWRISVTKEVSIIEKEIEKEQQTKLACSLEELSAKQRQALLLYYYEGFTHQEISDIMELKNKSSVRKLIFRAIDSLKQSFAL